ncbi:hypothetical protein GIW81_15610 [Hyphomicrobium sp. xq]|uniref:Uncharacterized protein n=1 Tax=Hyphomicrobium album TaxID=2665159 RepID=A0A6I3KJ63_9HYPH|nr:hypothetical protein [Hyphomicrobium album]MTD95765.1 hypothetical protein [Hyphomicrobium album]
MRRIRAGYLVLIAIVIVMNGLALLQHLGMLPEISGFLAATLLANMLVIPVVIWGAFVLGEVVEGLPGRKVRRAAR